VARDDDDGVGHIADSASVSAYADLRIRALATCRSIQRQAASQRNAVTDRLLQLEEEGWQALSSSDPVSFCQEWLADDAVVIVPGMIISRAEFLQALAHEEPWASHRIEEPQTLQLTGDSAALVYRVTARREGQPTFTGLLTSVYVNRAGRWRLTLHQQTPMPTVE
jgi:Domain of unknown function (DUF4440)